MTSISLANVCKKFDGAAPVIRNVDLEIAAGEFCVFLGPSGCGKSTLLRMIAGIEAITSGEVRINGERMNEVPPARRRVAMVFQNYALYPHMTVRQNMEFGLRQARTPPAEIENRVAEAARVLQIQPLLDRMPRELSGGQRQRVAIGRAIVRKPNVFLFDEPLSNLDAALRVHMRSEIARLHRDYPHASVVYVTHDQTEAMALADRIVLLRAGSDREQQGSIAQVGTPLELYHRPGSLFVAAFLGSPRMNFLPVVIAAIDPDGVVVRLRDSGETLRVPVAAGTARPGDAATLGVRPEHLQPIAPALSGPAPQTITRAVRAVERFGEYDYVYLTGADGEDVIAKLGGGTGVSTGPLTFSVPPGSCHLFGTDGMTFERRAGG
ncbi:MAG: ATP-binding cassette domain-containing protein [Azospirillaceae bacterium]|nr:ATP-binding cassette domain-containing protein [Azospirillaceae bacterium]